MDRTQATRLAVVMTAMILSGMMAAETGTTLERIGVDFGLDEAALGWVVSSRFLGGIIASIGVLVHPPRRRVLPVFLLAAGLVLVSFAPLVLARGFVGVFVAGFLRGIATGAALPVANYTIGLWFSHRPGRYAGVIHSSFGVGLVLAPLLGRALLAAALPWQSVWALAALPAVGISVWAPFIAGRVAIAAPGVAAPETRATAESAPGAVGDHERSGRETRAAWLLWALVFAVVGAEAVVVGWIPAAVGTRSPVASETLALVLSASILFGRALSGALADAVGVARYHRLTVVLLAVAMAIPPGSQSSARAVAHVILAGVSMAAVYPTMAALAVQRFSAARRRTFMAMGLAGAIGGSIVPAVVGYLARGGGRFALAQGALPALALVLLFGVLLAPPGRAVGREPRPG